MEKEQRKVDETAGDQGHGEYIPSSAQHYFLHYDMVRIVVINFISVSTSSDCIDGKS